LAYLKFVCGLEGLKKNMTNLSQNGLPFKAKLLLEAGGSCLKQTVVMLLYCCESKIFRYFFNAIVNHAASLIHFKWHQQKVASLKGVAVNAEFYVGNGLGRKCIGCGLMRIIHYHWLHVT
jgi:hypothetical protein